MKPVKTLLCKTKTELVANLHLKSILSPLMLNRRGLDKGGRANLFFTFAVGGGEEEEDVDDNTFDHSLPHQYVAE